MDLAIIPLSSLQMYLTVIVYCFDNHVILTLILFILCVYFNMNYIIRIHMCTVIYICGN